MGKAENLAPTDRLTAGLSGRNVATIWDAVTHAKRIGQPLNMHLTVYWDNIDNPEGLTIQERHASMRECMQKWLYRKSLILCDAWVIERGGKAGGLHVHQVPHVPAEHLDAFAAMLPAWIGVPAGDLDGAEKHTIARGVDGIWQLDEYDGRANLIQYIMKGFLPGSAGINTYTTRKGIEKRAPAVPYNIKTQTAGFVTGKRSGVANSLGPNAISNWQAENANSTARVPVPGRPL
jgi:hypothetical protein